MSPSAARARTVSWNRIEAFGAELSLADDSAGLRATGWALGSVPVGYRCEYTLGTDPQWRTTTLEVSAVGDGWSRRLVLTKRPDGWRVRASETGALDAPPPGAEYPERFDEAIDIDLGYSPLTNTLPIRRLGLRRGGTPEPGVEHEILVAFVEVPSLAVTAAVQYYSVLPDGRVLFRADSGYRAELDVDEAGYVDHYPGLAQRI